MRYENVMGLEGRELDEAVARRLGLHVYSDDPTILLFIPGNKPRQTHQEDMRPVPHFATDWTATMQIREWARGLGEREQFSFVQWVVQMTEHRIGHTIPVSVLLDAEPIDYARAFLAMPS